MTEIHARNIDTGHFLKTIVPCHLCLQASSINNTNAIEQILEPPLSSAAGQLQQAWIAEPLPPERQLALDEEDNFLPSPPLSTAHKAPTFEAESVENKAGKCLAFSLRWHRFVLWVTPRVLTDIRSCSIFGKKKATEGQE